jgi:hypothetical protein
VFSLPALLTLSLFLVGMGCGGGGEKDTADESDASLSTDAGPDASTPPAPGEFALLGTMPADQAVNVVRNVAVVLSFSTPVQQDSLSADTFFLYPSSAGAQAKVAGAFSFSADLKSVTLKPSANLAGDTAHTVVVRSGSAGVLDAEGQTLAADISFTFTTANEDDTTPPSLVSIQPSHGAIDVPLDSTIELVFSEPIDPTTLDANFELIEWWDGNPQGEALSGTFDTSRNPTIVFTPEAMFDKGDELKVTVRGAIEDLAGNQMGQTHSAIFTAAWVTPGQEPQVIETYPANSMTGVFTNTSIQITFDRRMQQSTVTSAPTSSATVKLYEVGSSATPVEMTRSYQTNPSFVFYPHSPLSPNTQYELHIQGGANGVKSENVQLPMTSDFKARFTTGTGADTSPLSVVSITPSNGATDVDQTTALTITFSQRIDPAKLFLDYPGQEGTLQVSDHIQLLHPEAGNIDFSQNPTITFNIDPTTTYALEKTYYVRVAGGANGVKAASGATMADDFISSFTTKAPIDGTIEDLRAVNGTCAIRVKNVFMTYFRSEPSTHKGFFVQKDKTGPAIFVDTGSYSPLFPVYPAPNSDIERYPNIDLTVTKVGEFNGFKQVEAYTMTQNTQDSVDLGFIKDNLVQVIGSETLGVDFESEYVQVDGTLENYKPGASKENREFDLVYDATSTPQKKVKLKINQDLIMELTGADAAGFAVGTKVRVLAPLQKDQNGFFLKPFFYTSQTPMTATELDDPENYENLLDIVQLVP